MITKETDYLIIGAGAMGMAFADELFIRDSNFQLTIVDRRARAGGHWMDAYPFVRLHQPVAFYGVNSLVLGNGTIPVLYPEFKDDWPVTLTETVEN